jgi:hypothetical protein
VWYRLTPKGNELAPVIESLAVWGIDHALRPPLPGEPVHPERAMQTITTFRNKRGVRLPRPAAWVVRFIGDGAYTLRFDGERWSYALGETAPDVLVEATAQDWVNFLLATSREDRRRLAEQIAVDGDAEQVAAFFTSFGLPAGSPTPAN